MQDKINDLKGTIVKAIEEKAAEIGDKLKPIMKTVSFLVLARVSQPAAACCTGHGQDC